MDIPLKEWHNYIDMENGFYLQELIESSKRHTYEQMENLELADEYHVTANYPSGMLIDYAAGEQHFYANLEIYEQLDGHPFYRYFPEHT